MKQNKKSKKTFIIALIAVLSLCVGIGFSALSQTLTIGGTATMDAMKWDVGFTETDTSSSEIPTTATISSDMKSVALTCDYSGETELRLCNATATITNNSTFDVKLKEAPIIEFDESDWFNGGVVAWDEDYYNSDYDLIAGQVIPAGESRKVYMTFQSKNITNDNIPENTQDVSILITMEWIEA